MRENVKNGIGKPIVVKGVIVSEIIGPILLINSNLHIRMIEIIPEGRASNRLLGHLENLGLI